ncbi:MAG: beta-ketoacyl synthase chain length factor [Tannerella sp.]|jgi:3-oxoacyl-(acyl-carrier-protein) synthase|nr:beta-ketoacyl synthase chain length factor [Tannerella sp.]
MSVYIQSASQISAQQPLSDEWFESPVYHDGKRIAAINPDFAPYLSPIQSRRMCSLLKRAIVTARVTLKAASVEMPDAIISGTGLGCIDNTEKFLHAIMENGEQFLQPTHFMQSTHNIISALIAIDLKCHGYNNTYVHRAVSFEHALMDACLQFRQHHIRTALVGGYDELTEDYYIFLGRLGLWDFTAGETTSPKKKCFAAETAVSMLLSTERNEQTLCEISGIEIMYRPSETLMRQTLDALLNGAGCSLSDIDAVMVGTDTNARNDAVYDAVVPRLFAGRPLAQYKHLFGQSFTASALGLYAATICLHRQCIPAHLLTGREESLRPVKRILFYNHYNKSHTFTLLSRCSN